MNRQRRTAARVQSRAKSRRAFRSSSVSASAAHRRHSLAYCFVFADRGRWRVSAPGTPSGTLKMSAKRDQSRFPRNPEGAHRGRPRGTHRLGFGISTRIALVRALFVIRPVRLDEPETYWCLALRARSEGNRHRLRLCNFWHRLVPGEAFS